MTSQECVTYIGGAIKKKQNKPLNEIISEMLDTILATNVTESAGIGCDNMTCMVVQLKQ